MCVTEIVIMLGEAVLPGHGSGPQLIVELINLPCSAQICPTCPLLSQAQGTTVDGKLFLSGLYFAVTHPIIENKC